MAPLGFFNPAMVKALLANKYASQWLSQPHKLLPFVLTTLAVSHFLFTDFKHGIALLEF